MSKHKLPTPEEAAKLWVADIKTAMTAGDKAIEALRALLRSMGIKNLEV